MPFDHPFILALCWIIGQDFVIHTKTAITIAQYAVDRRSSLLHSDIIDSVLQRFNANQSRHANVNSANFLLEKIDLFGDNDDNTNQTMQWPELEFDCQCISDEDIYAATYQPKTRAIWFVDSFEAFLRLEHDILDMRNIYDRHGFFFVMYTSSTTADMSELQTIFERLLNIYVLNVDILIIQDSTTNVYTYIPFLENHCYKAVPVLHTSFAGLTAEGEFDTPVPIFPDKLANMNKCDVTVATWDLPPFIMTKRDALTGDVLKVHGIEGLLLTLLAEKMNFTIRVIEPTPRERGEIFDNGTATAAAGLVVDGICNMTILSYMIEKKRSEAMLATYSYLTCPMVIAIPKGKKMSPFERLAKPFLYRIWILLSTSVLVAIIVIFCVKASRRRRLKVLVFGKHNRTPFTNLLNSLYGGTMYGELPFRNFPRFLLIMWLMYTTVLRNAYSGKLFGILQDARARTTLTTIEEVVHKNYTFILFPVLEEIVRETTGSQNIKYVDGAYNSMPNLLERLQSEDADFVFPVCEYYVHQYNQNNLNNGRFVNTLKELLIEASLVIYLRHYSYFLRPINDILLDVLATGFVENFDQLYVNYDLSKRRSSSSNTPLTVAMLMGLFVLCGALSILCVLVFCFEIFTYRWRRARRILNFFNY